MKKLTLILPILIFTFLSIHGQNIPRKGFLGIRALEINDSISAANRLSLSKGVMINDITPASTSEQLGIMKYDILLKVNGSDISNIKDYRNAAKNFREGEDISFLILRGNEELLIQGKVLPLPYEKSDLFDVIYDEVKFRDGWLRIIVNKPKEEGKHPVIFFIPGYTCYSLDNIGKHPYGQLIDGLCAKGYVIIRVEKPGMGDCFNTPDCFEIDFSTEVEAFETGFQKIINYDFTDKKRIYILGHSLGGLEAPLIDKDKISRGVIVCGTGVKTWFEYIIEMFRFQNIIMGVDYVDNEVFINKMIPVLYDFLIMKKSPSEIAINDEIKKMMAEYLEYDGFEHIWSRNYKYWQQLQDQNMPELWKQVKGDVLVIRGEADFEAFSNTDHQEIVNIVNAYKPGTAQFILIPELDHGFAKSKTPEESYINRSKRGYYYENFNPAIIDEIHNWITARR